MEYAAPTYDYLVKTVIVGDSGVGKSALLKRFSDREFISNYISTIGVDFVIRTLDLNGKITKLQIWDTAGQERFRTITNSYYRGANCILIVFDVTDVDSFKNVHNWWREVQMYATEQTQVMLVANKTDLTNHRMVTQEQAAGLATELKIPLVETSAKTSSNVDGAFTTIAQQFINEQHTLKTDTQPKAPESGSGFSLLDEDSAIKKCCVIM